MSDKFSEKAKDWDKRPLAKKLTEKFIKEVRDSIEINKEFTLMDFGCGTGLIGLDFVDDVEKLFMVDTSEAMLEVLKDKVGKQKINNVSIFKGDIKGLNIEQASVDIIVSFMAFHHLENIPEIIMIFNKILKNGGVIIVGDLLEEDGSFHGDDKVAHNGFSLNSIEEYFPKDQFEKKKLKKYNSFKRPENNNVYNQFIAIFKKDQNK